MEYYSSDDYSYMTDDDSYTTDAAAYMKDLYSLPKMEGFDQPLSLEIDYLPTWIFRDCFREVCQNWSDGMRESNNLRNRNFTTKIDDTKSSWIARALHPDTRVLIGYIRFQKKKGMIELTNFNARLSRRTLNFGGGDKHTKPHLAGGKGEGYKVAAVVALKNGYQFRYEASGCYWRFHVGRDYPEQVYCKLKPMKSQALERTAAKYTANFSNSRPRDEHNYIHKDVSVKIGNVYSSEVFPGLKITDQVFRECIKVSLDLVSPSSMIITPDGDLILDREFEDKTYLKRLLVEGNPSIFKYKFGYHFYEGLIDRDRRRIPSTKEDASCVASIWHHAINTRPEFLAIYIDMIEDQITKWADVHLAKDYVSKETAEKMARHYFGRDPRQNTFYHDSRNGGKEIEIIIRSLKKKPQQLVPVAWDILRKYGLVRTPQEEQERILMNAPEAQDNGTPYSNSVKRALMASLLLSPRTKNLQLSFRSGAKADLDLLLCGSVLNVNEKWLDFRASHEQTPCRLSRVSDPQFHNNDCFSCHHIVFRLHELVLEELAMHNDSNDDLINADLSLHQKVQDSLSQMPIMIEVNATERPGEISVSWTDLDFVSRVHKLHSHYRVTLHREITCSHTRGNLLTPDQIIEIPPFGANDVGSNPQSTAACGCPEKIASQTDGKAIFHDLDAANEYFPMVARTDTQSFFGDPPNAVRPLPHSFQLPTRSFPPTAQILPPEFDLDALYKSENLYEASDAGDNAMDVHMELPDQQFSDPTLRNGTDIELHGLRARPISQEMPYIRHQIENEPQELERKLPNIANYPEHRPGREANSTSSQNEELSGHNEFNPRHKVTERGHHELGVDVKRLRESLQVLRANLQSKEEELHAAKLSVENLQARDAAATETISNLKAEIRKLRETNDELEADLFTAQDIHRQRDQLDANRAARLRTSTHGVKREIKDEDGDENWSARGKKSARGDNSNQSSAENFIMLD